MKTAIFFLFSLVFTTSLMAQRAPATLTNPDHVNMYYRITADYNCLCGCHAALSECGHVDDGCFGVKMRDFIERRILAGDSEQDIRNGLVSGFGEELRNDRFVMSIARTGDRGFEEGVVNGFGSAIIHERPPSRTYLWPVSLTVAIFAVLVFALTFKKDGLKKINNGLKRDDKHRDPTESENTEKSKNDSETAETRILDSISDLDR